MRRQAGELRDRRAQEAAADRELSRCARPVCLWLFVSHHLPSLSEPPTFTHCLYSTAAAEAAVVHDCLPSVS